MDGPVVVAVHKAAGHDFSKLPAGEIELVAGLGVAGDAHCGARVRHRSRVRADPSQPNLRQVHLLHAELLAELAERGHTVKPGDLGENVTTRGIDWPYFDQSGLRQSEMIETVERFTLDSAGSRLDYALTVTDPWLFAEPVTLTKSWRWVPGDEVLPFDCEYE